LFAFYLEPKNNFCVQDKFKAGRTFYSFLRINNDGKFIFENKINFSKCSDEQNKFLKIQNIFENKINLFCNDEECFLSLNC